MIWRLGLSSIIEFVACANLPPRECLTSRNVMSYRRELKTLTGFKLNLSKSLAITSCTSIPNLMVIGSPSLRRLEESQKKLNFNSPSANWVTAWRVAFSWCSTVSSNYFSLKSTWCSTHYRAARGVKTLTIPIKFIKFVPLNYIPEANSNLMIIGHHLQLDWRILQKVVNS